MIKLSKPNTNILKSAYNKVNKKTFLFLFFITNNSCDINDEIKTVPTENAIIAYEYPFTPNEEVVSK